MIVFLYGLLLQAHTPEGVFFFKEPAHIPAVNLAGVQKAKAIAALREVPALIHFVGLDLITYCPNESHSFI